jgi:hypothetical protein
VPPDAPDLGALDLPAIPPVPERQQREPTSDRDLMAAEAHQNLILDAALSTPRSLQARLGPSEIGSLCSRRVAYRLAGTPYVNIPDPTAAMIGTGFHSGIADGIERLYGNTQRFLTEVAVEYRGVRGSADLFDRYKHRLTDWKTTRLKVVRRYRREGVPLNSRVQLNIYAAGLAAAGETVTDLVLCYVPIDGTLADIEAFVLRPDQRLADEYIDRYYAIKQRLDNGASPADIDAQPSPLCAWCPSYQPATSNLETACPGRFN